MEIKSRRLLLRPLAESDAPALLDAVDSSRDILRRRLRWTSSMTGINDAKEFIERSQQETSSGASLVLGIFESRTNKLAGVAALMRSKDSERAKLGCWIRLDRQMKGYSTEAGKATIDYGFRKIGIHRLYARIDPANRAIRKVLKKLGFRYEGCLRDDKRLNGRWIDQECWGLLRSEWKK